MTLEKEIEVTMEIETTGPRKFMSRYKRYEPKIKDHTAIITAKTCLRKYFFVIVLGRVSKEQAIYFAWGSSVHKFREVLEKAFGYGHNTPKKFIEAEAAECFATASQAGLAYWKKKGRDQEVGTKYDFMTTERLLKSFIVAFKHWSKEKQQGKIEVIAVEQPFNVQMPNGQSTSGKFDQIIRWLRKLYGRDFKTTSKKAEFFARQLEPNDQFTRYTWAEQQLCGEPVQGQFVELLYNAKSTKNKQNGPEIYEHITSRTPQQLERWVEEEAFMIQTLDRAREQDMYPLYEVSCPFCPFHSVCQKGTENAMMAQLEAHFDVRPWDNTKIGMEMD